MVGLGDGDPVDDVTARDAGEPLRSQFLVGVLVDDVDVRREPAESERPAEVGVGSPRLLGDDSALDHVVARAAVLLRDHVADVPLGGGGREELVRERPGLVELVGDRFDVFLAERLDVLSELGLLRRKAVCHTGKW